MSAGVERGRSRRRGVAAGALIVLNLVLAALNLDKHDLLPVSFGIWPEDTSETAAGGSDTEPTTAPVSPDDGADVDTDEAGSAEAMETDEGAVAADGDDSVSAGGATTTTAADDWPGGRGPVPEGPPVPRRAVIQPDGRLDLTGSAPDWATASRVADYAGQNLPGGIEAVNNQLAWHPEASPDVRSGDVVMERAATFAVGQAVIEPSSFPTLDLAADLLRSRPSLFVVVIGHTDDVGDTETNAALALDRANAVVDYLVAAGAVPGQVVVASAGEDDPTASNETEAGREANRRIELRFKNFLIPPQDFGLAQE